MPRLALISLSAVVLPGLLSAETLRTVAELYATPLNGSISTPFDLTAKIIVPTIGTQSRILVDDGTGFAYLLLRDSTTNSTACTVGAVLRLRGFRSDANVCQSVTLLRQDAPTETRRVSGEDFFQRARLNDFVRLTGTVRATSPDEIDPAYHLLLLDTGRESVYCSVILNDTDPRIFSRFVGTDIDIEGIVIGPTKNIGGRSRFGRILFVPHVRYIHPVSRGTGPQGEIPRLETIRFDKPSGLQGVGRHRATGTVLSAWGNAHVLIKTERNDILRADMAQPPLPPPGKFIEVIGFPETDLYRLNLVCANWHPAIGSGAEEEGPVDISIARLMTNRQGRPQFHPAFHGRVIRITGILRKTADGQLRLQADDHEISLLSDLCPNALSDVTDGSTVRLTGICIMDGAAATPGTLPTIHSVSLSLRRPGDVTVLSHPSWWTPERLRTAVFVLLLVVLAFAALSEFLRRLAERRGKALADEAVARVEADLKAVERTRLAVELHDSMSQTLTGVAYEIDTATRLARREPTLMERHLTIAVRALHTLRDELRNCLWDLRNDALETDDLDTAIRKTLQPHLGAAELLVRFNVPRTLLRDATAHTLLCVLRELTCNAIRHGQARTIRIAGGLDNGALVFSVRDDGHGFDPSQAPGLREGHYGLQGVRERIAQLNGTFDLSSRAGAGTKAIIRIPLPKELQQ